VAIKRTITLQIDEDDHPIYSCDPPGTATWDVVLGDLIRAFEIVKLDVAVAQITAKLEGGMLRRMVRT